MSEQIQSEVPVSNDLPPQEAPAPADVPQIQAAEPEAAEPSAVKLPPSQVEAPKEQVSKHEEAAPEGEKKKADNKEGEGKKVKDTRYILQERKVFQISQRHEQRVAQAIISKEITYGLFGNRRFKSIFLKSSLNHFYTALNISNILYNRVPGLHMVVEICKEKYTQFQSEEDQVGQEKELSTFSIKLTKYPTEADKNSLGYHEGKKLEDIESPITGIRLRNNKEAREQRKKNRDNYSKLEKEKKEKERKEAKEAKEKEAKQAKEKKEREKKEQKEKKEEEKRAKQNEKEQKNKGDTRPTKEEKKVYPRRQKDEKIERKPRQNENKDLKDHKNTRSNKEDREHRDDRGGHNRSSYQTERRNPNGYRQEDEYDHRQSRYPRKNDYRDQRYYNNYPEDKRQQRRQEIQGRRRQTNVNYRGSDRPYYRNNGREDNRNRQPRQDERTADRKPVEQPKHRTEREESNQYRRGEAKTRGVAGHNYDQSHLRPRPRENRYSDED